MTTIDDRILAGLRDQLAVRRERLRGGERAIGWKVGFGAPGAIEKLGTGRPLAGFLLDTGVLPDGAEVPIGGWANPALEAEIAVWMAADVPGDATREQVAGAILGMSAAIELADVHPPPTDVRAIVAGNVFHRHVVLGPVDRDRRDGSGVTCRVTRDGDEIAATETPAELAGEVVEIVRQTAELLAAAGEQLRAGEVVITGTVVLPIAVRPGQRIRVDLPPLGTLAVSFTD